MINVYVARGILIESTAGSWLWGTAAEHAVLYQYTLSGASNVVMGLIQTESPYFQPLASAALPAPFSASLGALPGDDQGVLTRCDGNSLTTAGCESAWALRVLGSTNVTVAGAGLYSFFRAYTQDCISARSCQVALGQLRNLRAKANVVLLGLYAIGARTFFDEADGYVSVPTQKYIAPQNLGNLMAVYLPELPAS